MPCLPKKVLFFWIGYRPEVEAFRWFLEQLALWEKKFEEIHARPENHDLFLDIQLYLTLRTAKDAAADYNQLKIDTRQGLVSISDLDAKMIRNAELERLQGELTQGRSSKSENNRRGTMVADDSVPPVADPWKSEYSEQVVSSGGSSVGAQTRQRRTPSMGSQDDLQYSRHDEETAKPKASSVRDPISGLKAPTVFGRPNWDRIFDDVVAEHNIKNWHVMFCGPRPLKVALEETCRKKTTTRAAFNFHGENF